MPEESPTCFKSWFAENPQNLVGIQLGWYVLKLTIESLHGEFTGTLMLQVCIEIHEQTTGRI